MCRKLSYLVPYVLALSAALTGTTKAELVGWWRFDEGSGTVAHDTSGNENDGTLQGDTKWVAGKIGGALEFNGTDSIVDIPYSPDMTPSEGTTMSAWVFPTDTTRSCIVGQFEGYGMALFTGLQLKSVIWGSDWVMSDVTIPVNEWSHIAMTWDVANAERTIFLNGELVGQRGDAAVPNIQNNLGIGLWVGWPDAWGDDSFMGIIDDVQIHNLVLTEDEIKIIMKGEGYPYALGPSPADGALHLDTWINLSWSPGDYAVSHNVYLGENFDDVNDGAESTFQGNQTSTFLVAGFPGFAYPDGLIPGTTYYWRIDEVNETEPNSPWKGDVWSFTIPPKTAYAPDPADTAESIDLNADLSWTAGFGAKLHTLYFGDNFDDVNNATVGISQGSTTYDPGPLELAKTYYWRVDEFDAIETYKGHVWSFTTEGAVGNPEPSNGAVDVKQTPILTWSPGIYAASHQ
ncbi:MAG: LamG domain-containing protein, partial [Phycisphaerae bacterium]